MKITDDIILVEDKDDHIKRCPGCFRREGQNHDEECFILRKTQIEQTDEAMSEFLENALRTQRDFRAKKKPVRIICPALDGSDESRVGGSGLGRVGDAVTDVYGAVRHKYPDKRLQVIIEGVEHCEGMHFRDIPGKRIPTDGQMSFRVQSRGAALAGTVTVTFKNRTVTEVEFQSP